MSDTPLNRHVALVGFMGAGKSTLGAQAAARIGRPFLDVDEEIERLTGSTIVELFADGESGFRSIEEEIACDVLAQSEPHVLALGGGAVLSERTRARLRERATTLHVPVDLDEAWRRVEGSGRPLAQGRERFGELYEERQPLYAGVADAAGFAAATYLRGIPWVPVPTSLVAQVDAAIGGKTAIDLPQGKNLVGVFHWPVRTIVDPVLLETLPEAQRREGLAEVVKTGL